MNRGTVFLKAWEERIIQERDAAVNVTRCAFCKWKTEGTLGETRDAYLAHRLQHHPEIQPPKRRQRHRPIGQITMTRNLDDNIAAARKQGASGWAGGQ